MKHTVLLDTDIGTDVDDALALVFAARSPEISLASVTTAGKRSQVRAQIARRLLDAADRADVPVIAGLQHALPSERFAPLVMEMLSMGPDGWWMGHEGRGLLTDEEIAAASAAHVDGERAVEAIIRTLTGLPEPAIVLTIGPLSNLGAALAREPAISTKISSIVAMGGSVGAETVVGGFPVPPVAEFNLNCDREAAWRVLTSGIPITLIPIELGMQGVFVDDDLAELRSDGDKATQAVCDLIDVWIPVLQGLFAGVPSEDIKRWVCLLNDPIALVALVRPDLFAFKEIRFRLSYEDDVLLTTPDPSGQITLTVATEMDLPAVRSFILERLKRPPLTPG